MSDPDEPSGNASGASDAREALIEAATTAFRPRDPFTGEVRVHHAYLDLDEAGRREAFERTLRLRRLEAALDSEGLSTTARAVLARLRPPGVP